MARLWIFWYFRLLVWLRLWWGMMWNDNSLALALSERVLWINFHWRLIDKICVILWTDHLLSRILLVGSERIGEDHLRWLRLLLLFFFGLLERHHQFFLQGLTRIVDEIESIWEIAMLKVNLFHLRGVIFELVDLLWKLGKGLQELSFVEAVVGLFAVSGRAFVAG